MVASFSSSLNQTGQWRREAPAPAVMTGVES